MEDQHKEEHDTSEHSETESDWETREELDMDAVADVISEELGKPTGESKGDRYYWTFMHSLLTFGTAGLWLLGLVAYWSWTLWIKAKHGEKDIVKQYRVKEFQE